MKQKVIWSAQLLLVALCALALKFYYSTATPDELLWILAPTTRLVELLSGQQFEFESYAGYMSSDHRFVIAVPCAGVNYLITAFLMIGLRRMWRERFEAVSWRFLSLAAVCAYVATLIANTARICVALELRARSVEVSWLTNNQLHRLEGIVVYFGFLLLLFVLFERFETADPISLGRVLIFPLLIYYAITLGVPLLTGFYQQATAGYLSGTAGSYLSGTAGSYDQGTAFWEHSVFVLVLPLLLVVPLVLFCAVQQKFADPRPKL